MTRRTKEQQTARDFQALTQWSYTRCLALVRDGYTVKDLHERECFTCHGEGDGGGDDESEPCETCEGAGFDDPSDPNYVPLVHAGEMAGHVLSMLAGARYATSPAVAVCALRVALRTVEAQCNQADGRSSGPVASADAALEQFGPITDAQLLAVIDDGGSAPLSSALRQFMISRGGPVSVGPVAH